MVKFLDKFMADKNPTAQENKRMRPPVVVVLGHVDHGKTKLLDFIKKTNVAGGESGGITQHIGAYQVEVNAKMITFLDTPGHEAFAAIRSRGAKVADIAVLVIAADESVKPQTKEAIRMIKDENMPFIVAINKIDKEGANPQKVKQDLAAEEVLVEDWGGKVPAVEISAKAGQNIPNLLEMILLVAELEELEENLDLPAKGVIIESHMDKRRGYVATGLVERGLLHSGDWLTVGAVMGKVKSLEDFNGKPITEARPSQPVLITGWVSAPEIGKTFMTSNSREGALKTVAENPSSFPSPLFSFQPVSEDESPKKIFNIIFKSDVSSSLEAIDNVLKSIKSDEVGYRVVGYGVGNISESDIKTAIAAKAQVVGFRVLTEESAQNIAKKENIKVTSFDVIYNLVEHMRSEMAGLLEPEVKRTLLGKLKVLALFKKDPKSQIIGGKVLSGKIVRGSVVDVVRSNNKMGGGKIIQLQHNKEDVIEVKEGLECGLRVELGKDLQEIRESDILEIYEEEKIPRSL